MSASTKSGLVLLAACVGPVILAACLTPSANLVQGEGGIVWKDIEGGFWGMQSESANYDPLDLPAEFRQAGLRVRFTGVVRPDAVSIHMWGAVLDLVSIQRVGP